MVLRLNWLGATLLIFSFSFAKATVAAKEKIKFKKASIALIQNKKKKTIKVELAETPRQLEYGLMFREKLNPNEGMLFIFDDEQIRQFWMKNTLIDLDIGYFDKDKKLVDIQQMKAITSIMQTDLPIYPSKLPAMYALEVSKGWFKKNKFNEGAEFKFLSGPLSK